MNSSVMSAAASQMEDPPNPDALGSLTTHLSRPMAPTLSAAAAAADPTAVLSTIPGFCGWSSSFLTLHAETEAMAASAATTRVIPRARFVCIIMIIVLGDGYQYLRLRRSVKYVGSPVVWNSFCASDCVSP